MQIMQKTTVLCHYPYRTKAEKWQNLNFYFAMKVSLLLLIIVISSTQLLLASRANGQSIEEKKISLELQNVPLKSALNKIEKVSGFKISYVTEQISKYQAANITNEKRSVAETLRLMLLNTKLDFRQENNVILIFPKLNERITATQNADEGIVNAAIVIQGTVTNENGELLSGVSVFVKGSPSIGTVTDAKGHYKLEVPENASTLVFSFVSTETKEVSIAGQKEINVTLKILSQQQDEVIIVGFGKQKRKDVTSAIAQVGSERIGERPVANMGQAMQGLVPNLNINFSNGSPNTNASFNIRGITTLNILNNGTDAKTLTSSPLILVDGVPGDINGINPEDVESVTVLKDASASAIYGVRAAFGVILITTKSGKQGKSQVEYTGSFQWSKPTAIPDLLDAATIQEAVIKGNEYRNLSVSALETEKLEKIKAYMADPVNNQPYYAQNPSNPNAITWIANVRPYDVALAKSSPMQKHVLSISGGTEKFKYYGSFGYQNQDGVYKINTDNLKRYNLNLNMSSKINDWFGMDYRVNYNATTYSEPHSPGGKGGWWIALAQDPGRNVNMLMKTPASSPVGVMYTDNILSFMDYGSRDWEGRNNLVLTASPKIKLLKGWNVQADISYQNNETSTKDIVPLLRRVENNWAQTTTVHTDPSYVSKSNNSINHYTINLYTDYSTTFGDHSLSAVVGYNQEWEKGLYFDATKTNINPNVPTLGAASGTQTVSDAEYQYAILGVFSRINYDYKGKYQLQVSGRYDGTSVFAQNRRYQLNPSVSAGWVISEEAFAQGLKPVVSFLKLKGSYGRVGNQVTYTKDASGNNVVRNYYAYLPVYLQGSNLDFLFDGALPSYIVPPGLIDPNITWEKVDNIGVGAEVSLFNKLNINFDWYSRTTSDILNPGLKLPNTLGSPEPPTNAGKIRTKGWELSVGYANKTSYGLNYNFLMTWGDYKAKVLSYPNPNLLLTDFYPGMTMGEIWGYETVGLFQSQDEIDKAAKQTKINSGVWFPGDVHYKDLNDDGEISAGSGTVTDPGDRKVIGNNTPRYQFGLNSTLSYKGFDFNLFLQGIAKRDLWVSNRLFWGAGWTGTYEIYNNSWTPDRRDAYYPLYYSATKNRQTQTRYLQNGAYLRVKNISLGYTVPQNLLGYTKVINKLRVYGAVYNLLDIKSVPKTFDPELTGIDYPILRSFALGVQVTF